MLIMFNIVVELHAPVVVASRLTGTVDVVKEWRARNIRGRQQGDDALCDSADTTRRDNIIHKRIPHKASLAVGTSRGRIVNGEGIVREIAGTFLHSGKSDEARMRQAAAQPKTRPCKEKVCFVLAVVI